MPKSTIGTVFVRFVPPSANVRRHLLEAVFSEIGPIKKSSVIHKSEPNKTDDEDQQNSASSYGFVKYTCHSDAEQAAKQLNHKSLTISETERVQLKVELASTAADKSKPKNKKQGPFTETTQPQDSGDATAAVSHSKRDCRLILRNLSFYAKESHIRQALQPFGELQEVHIPTVQNESSATTHRGFAFVTFFNATDAQRCLECKEPVVIKKRPVQIAFALNKTSYEHQKSKNSRSGSDQKHESEEHEEEEEAQEDDEKERNEDTSSDDSESSENDSSEDEDEEQPEENDEEVAAADKEEIKADPAVEHKQTLFVRNLPFDATRHDLFEIFHKFGHVSSIYLVKDKQTGMPKGTAFVSYQKPQAAQRALDAANNNGSFVSQRQVTTSADAAMATTGIVCKGRRLFCDLAVDKETATTLTVQKDQDSKKITGRDRRHLYLKSEGRVDNNPDTPTAWDDLPESDQLKRQRAWSDKNTKLRSPLFSISPTRLSIRNLAKHVDESDLKRLCVMATQRGLDADLVSAQDQIALWKATGDLSTREILARIQELGGETNKKAILPDFDTKNVKRFIPSVFIDRDFGGLAKKKSDAPSRGFGFVDFEHHVHALACLRELNNNPRYAAEFVTGGKQTTDLARRRAGRKDTQSSEFVGGDGRAKTPRLIVEFSVENIVKAKQQTEHRAQQQANIIKQKLEHREKSSKKAKKSKSRGVKQRERKRKERSEGKQEPGETTIEPTKKTKTRDDGSKGTNKAEKIKLAKPPKKRKVDKEEETFSKLVESYKESFSGKSKTDKKPPAKKSEKRWFE